jgi:hypothetical protein
MRTIVVLGCGPSLNQEDVNYCIGKADVIAVNDAWRLAPWADWLYAADVQWWKVHHAAVKADFRGESWTQSKEAADAYGLRYMESREGAGLSRDSHFVFQGSNSGHQAIGLAYHLGAHRIVLLGFDMCADREGRPHFHGSHPRPLADPLPLSFKVWKEAFNPLAEDLAWADVPIFNCSRHTELRCFRRGALETILGPDT